MKHLTSLLLSTAILAACTADAPLGLDVEASSRARATENAKVSVLTWNIYVGAQLQSLLLVTDPNQIPLAGDAVYRRGNAAASQTHVIRLYPLAEGESYSANVTIDTALVIEGTPDARRIAAGYSNLVQAAIALLLHRHKPNHSKPAIKNKLWLQKTS